MTHVTISVVSHGHGLLLDNLLLDLARQERNGHVCVVVTLNRGDERFCASRYPDLDIRVIRNREPKGFGANHNAAFAECEGEWFFVVNPDVRMPDATVIRRLIDGPTAVAGIMSPRIMNSSGVCEDAVRSNLSLISLVARVIGRRRSPITATDTRLGQPFFWVAGMFMVVRTEVFREIGGFDQRYFLYCEDYDLCARAYLAGYPIVVRSDVEVIHDAQRDSHRSGKHLRWHIASLLKVWSSGAFWRVAFQRPTAG